jgi:hypothetical protein
MIDIKEYLKYYIGCDVIVDGEEKGKFVGASLVPNSVDQIYYNIHLYESYKDEDEDFMMPFNDDTSPDCRIKPILRRLENLTDKENKELGKAALNMFTNQISYNADQFHYLLSRGFWLFGDEAFTEGLVIDAETLKAK